MTYFKASQYFDDNQTVKDKPFAVCFFTHDGYRKKIEDSPDHWEYYSKLCNATKSRENFNKIMDKLNR